MLISVKKKFQEKFFCYYISLTYILYDILFLFYIFADVNRINKIKNILVWL